MGEEGSLKMLKRVEYSTIIGKFEHSYYIATHQSLVEVLKLVWEITKLSRRTIAVDETGSKGWQKTCTNTCTYM
jgi:hypothetical protein